MAEETSQGQKTEEPTPRKLEKALEEGQIAFSSDLLSGLALLTGTLFFLAMGKWFFDGLRTIVRERATFVEPMIQHPDTLLLAIRRDLIQAGTVCLALVIPITLVVLAASFLQTRFNLSMKPLMWKWSKLKPSHGFKRIFSTRSLNRGGVAIAKAAAIALVASLFTVAWLGDVAQSGRSTLEYAIQLGGQLTLTIALLSALLMVAVGLADYGFQWWKQRRELRMSIQEVRDEHKESEGDPQIKARIRRIANEIGKRRMLQAVPTATVVVTNPTHYAVALRYDPGEAPAPIVVAKGVDHLAMQIIKIAKDHGVAVVERKSVARYLYAKVRLGQQIPYHLFQAVAEILNFIRRVDQRSA